MRRCYSQIPAILPEQEGNWTKIPTEERPHQGTEQRLPLARKKKDVSEDCNLFEILMDFLLITYKKTGCLCLNHNGWNFVIQGNPRKPIGSLLFWYSLERSGLFLKSAYINSMLCVTNTHFSIRIYCGYSNNTLRNALQSLFTRRCPCGMANKITFHFCSVSPWTANYIGLAMMNSVLWYTWNFKI